MKRDVSSFFHDSGIEITLARLPMATGFCFGRAENLENYLFFCSNGEQGI